MHSTLHAFGVAAGTVPSGISAVLYRIPGSILHSCGTRVGVGVGVGTGVGGIDVGADVGVDVPRGVADFGAAVGDVVGAAVGADVGWTAGALVVVANLFAKHLHLTEDPAIKPVSGP